MAIVYALIMLCSITACGILLRTTQRSLQLTNLQKIGLGLGAFCGSMLIAKVPFIFLNYQEFDWSRPWVDGKTIMLGLAGGYLGVEIAKWQMNLKTKTGDSFAFPVAVAIAIGRLACFCGGCCHGKPTDMWWGVHFSIVDGDNSIFRHPTQIFEFIFHITCACILLWLFRRLYIVETARTTERKWLQGNLIKIYFLIYFIYRFLTEYLRPEPVFDIGFTFYQLAAIVLFFVFGALWLTEVFSKPTEPAPQNTRPDF